MKIPILPFFTILLALTVAAPKSVLANPVDLLKGIGRVFTSAGDEAAEAAAGKAAAEAGEQAARQAASATLSAADETALLLRAAAKHGDDVHRLARLGPAVSKALARNADALVPLAKTYGDDILLLEVKAPGSANLLIGKLDLPLLQKVGRHATEPEIRALCILAKSGSTAAMKQCAKSVSRGGGWIYQRFPVKELLYTAGIGLAVYVAWHAPHHLLRFVMESLAGIHGQAPALLAWLALGVVVYMLRKPLRLLATPIWRLIKRAFTRRQKVPRAAQQRHGGVNGI